MGGMAWKRYTGHLMREREKAVLKQDDSQETAGFSYPYNNRTIHLITNIGKHEVTIRC